MRQSQNLKSHEAQRLRKVPELSFVSEKPGALLPFRIFRKHSAKFENHQSQFSSGSAAIFFSLRISWDSTIAQQCGKLYIDPRILEKGEYSDLSDLALGIMPDTAARALRTQIDSQ
jgi:hypothetical protein